jgi:hypothetical protein
MIALFLFRRRDWWMVAELAAEGVAACAWIVGWMV